MEQIIRIGMDTSKHVFQLHGVNAAEQRHGNPAAIVHPVFAAELILTEDQNAHLVARAKPVRAGRYLG